MYETMTFDKFDAAIAPKVRGALSLHNALKQTPLDFFVMTSSISAVLGNPGQSNYCAGNSFLDSLAWHRNVSGLAATSIALPMVLDVGVVAENEDIEASLGRKGMYGIDENEMLRGLEVAMLQAQPGYPFPPQIRNAQIILGLEAASLAKAMSSRNTIDAFWYNDARLKGVRAGVEGTSKKTAKAGSSFLEGLQNTTVMTPAEVIDAIAKYLMARCSRILMRDMEEFDMEGKSVADYGLDSMIGAELRNWLFKEFSLDMPFQKLLAAELTFKALSIEVGEKVGVIERSEKGSV